MNRTVIYCLLILLLSLRSLFACGQQYKAIVLENEALRFTWNKAKEGYVMNELTLRSGGKLYSFSGVKGIYTILYTPEKPSNSRQEILNEKGLPIQFPEPEYYYLDSKWRSSTTAVALNRAGKAFLFYPSSVSQKNDVLHFTNKNSTFVTEARWQLDPRYKNDLLVNITIKALKTGFFSIATPTLFNTDADKFGWAAIPGVLQGKAINQNFIDAFVYGHGVPGIPVVTRERTAAALTSILTNKEGRTLAVTAEPGIGRDPWAYDSNTHKDWLLGLSCMNRQGKLMPTLYHPVLGEKHSFLKEGEQLTFSFRYTIKNDDWYEVYKHVVNNIYQFNNFLSLKQTKEPLSERLNRLFFYVRNDSISRWRVFDYNSMTIGAQEYLGGVYNSEKDAVKNADYGAMWMMANITGDSVLKNKRLPYALNFKLSQQNLKDSFLMGATAGQYYLYKSKRFTEEWGPYSEPMATTYYMLMDIGNILLFEPQNKELKKALSLAADWLLNKMQPDGNWEIAYRNDTRQPLLPGEQDYRPTFYGLLVAYKILRNQKYLDGAIKGADWFVENAVNNGYYLGVCGDTRFVPDFATGQSAQALLDLYEITGKEKYKNAAVNVGRMYTTSIYSHPIPSALQKKVGNRIVKDWEISQVGLSFEHGGTHGSANNNGPILLCSHAGMFVRLYQITKDTLYLNMARAAAWGRDAFVDSAGVTSYYWRMMNNGAGPFPHHAWWQIGWIMDYLIAEADMRSMKKISFPHGFVTPKVGPHLTYGFAEGSVMGNKAALILRPGLIKLMNAQMECLTAVNEIKKKLYLIILNNSMKKEASSFELNMTTLFPGRRISVISMRDITVPGKGKRFSDSLITIYPVGMKVLEVSYKQKN